MSKFSQRADELLALTPLVDDLYGRSQAAIWWDTPNPLFGGMSPSMTVATGEGELVRKFVAERRAAKSRAKEVKP